MFAIEEINSRSDILPNITLGYKIYDSCVLEHKAVQSALSILSGREEAVPNYSCEEKSKVLAFIGHMMSSSSLSIAEITGLYGYPQISYGAMDSIFNDKLRFPSFYRTVPDERAQYEAIVLLLKHFGWNWVGIVRMDDESSQRAGMELRRVITQGGICLAFQVIESETRTESTMTTDGFVLHHHKVINQILKTTCDVIIFIGNSQVLTNLQWKILNQYQHRKVFLLPLFFTEWNVLGGLTLPESLQIALHRRNIPGLTDYLLRVGPYKHPDSSITSHVWRHFDSYFAPPGNYRSRLYNDTNMVINMDPLLYDTSNFRFTFSVYSAVYAVAYALHDLPLHKGNLKSLVKNTSRMLTKVIT